MPRGFDVGEDFLDFPILADHKRGARDAHYLLPVHILLLENAVGFGHFFVDVAKKRERQIVLGFESRLGGWSIRGNAKDRSSFLAELLDRVTKLVSFCGSARCIGARKEIQHHPLAFQLGKLKRLVSVGLELDLGSFVAFLEH